MPPGVERHSKRLARLGMADHRPEPLLILVLDAYIFEIGDPCDHI
jgi:hypothetical protein